MLSLEGLAGGTEKTPLVVHLPGFNEDSVRATPVLEVYAAGVRYRKALDTLVAEAAAGRVRPEQIAAFREHGSPSLEGADAWLSSLLEDDRGELAAALRAMTLTALLDQLLAPGYVADRLGEPKDRVAVLERLQAAMGMPAAWRDSYTDEGSAGAGRRGGQQHRGGGGLARPATERGGPGAIPASGRPRGGDGGSGDAGRPAGPAPVRPASRGVRGPSAVRGAD
jgi:hypothetical protein